MRTGMLFLFVLIPAAFGADPVSIRFMDERFSSEWPGKVTHNDDHYSFNIRILDPSSRDTAVRFWIASKAGKDSDTPRAVRAGDSSYRSKVYIQGSINQGTLAVRWVDTVICAYRGTSDTVFLLHSLGLARPRLRFWEAGGMLEYDLLGRKPGSGKAGEGPHGPSADSNGSSRPETGPAAGGRPRGPGPG